jgi:SAM-dependent methyltransferase
MTYEGPDFYDDKAVYKTYLARRQRYNNPNATLEKPVVLELIGDLTEKRILDIGCGDAMFGREALARGCQSYLGVDGSSNMVESARTVLAGTKGEIVQAALENWDYPAAAFDLVISRLVLHYIRDVDSVFRQIYKALVISGLFVFSVEHPVITSSDRGWQSEGPRQDWIVDSYFDAGQRLTSWMGGKVIKYHRTVENYFTSLRRAGFVVEDLREAEPKPERFEGDEETYQRRRRIPLFLIMAARKC